MKKLVICTFTTNWLPKPVNSTVEDFNDKLSIVALFDDVSGFGDVNIV